MSGVVEKQSSFNRGDNPYLNLRQAYENFEDVLARSTTFDSHNSKRKIEEHK